ncbi:MAG: transglutaminase domain-containing protein [Lachnospiraceae bacterium]
MKRRKLGKLIFLMAVIVGVCLISSSVCVNASYYFDEEMLQEIEKEMRRLEEEERVKWGYSGKNCKYDVGKLIVQVESKEELFEDIGYRIRNHEEEIYYDTHTRVWKDDIMDDYSYYCNQNDLLTSGKYQSFYLNSIEISVEKGYYPDGHTVRLYMQFDYKYSKEEMDAYYDKMRVLAEELKKESDFDSVKSAYDYIINNVEYDDTHTNYLDYEGFRDGVMVCNGYSMALFHLLVDMNIPVRMVSGYVGTEEGVGRHAWNVVKVDGAWYNVDATWDDPGEEGDIQYTYFLKCDEDFKNHYRSDKYKGYGKDISPESYPLKEEIVSDNSASTNPSGETEDEVDFEEMIYYMMMSVFGILFILMVIVVFPKILSEKND